MGWRYRDLFLDGQYLHHTGPHTDFLPIYISIFLSFNPPITQPDQIQNDTSYGKNVHPADTIGVTPFIQKTIPRSPIPNIITVSSFLFLLIKLQESLNISHIENIPGIPMHLFSVFV